MSTTARRQPEDPTADRVELVLDHHCDLGEGPVWHDGAVWFVDIYAGEIHRFDPATAAHEVRMVTEGTLSAVLPCTDGHWLLVLTAGFALLDWASGQIEPLVMLEDAAPNNRFNDAKADPTGRVWAGTMNNAMERDKARLFRLDHDHTVRTMVEPVSLSNGLAWTGDGSRMFYIDTPTKKVDVFDFDGAAPEPHTPARNRRTLMEFGPFEGSPDGMAIDAEDHVWVALWGGSRVVRLHGETGERLDEIQLPASQVTSCCFGGEGLRDLFITTARTGLSGERLQVEPHAGGLFRARLAVGGTPAALYGRPTDR